MGAKKEFWCLKNRSTQSTGWIWLNWFLLDSREIEVFLWSFLCFYEQGNIGRFSFTHKIFGCEMTENRKVSLISQEEKYIRLAISRQSYRKLILKMATYAQETSFFTINGVFVKLNLLMYIFSTHKNTNKSQNIPVFGY